MNAPLIDPADECQNLSCSRIDGKCVGMHCGRCGGPCSGQGHYFSWCGVTQQLGEFHFCCPGDCELNARSYTEEAGQ